MPLTLVAISRLSASPGSARLCLIATGLLCGAGATLSRAGALALAVGLVVLCLLCGTRTVVGVMAGPCAGAGVALLGRVGSLPVGARPQPVVATIALGAGLGIAAVTQRFPGAVVAALAVAGALGAALILINGASGFHNSWRHLTVSRLSLASPARSGETAAAVRLAGHHPLAGVGPQGAALRWRGAGGSLRVDMYDHDEYLQVLTDLGVIGAGLLALFLAAVTGTLWRARRNLPDRPMGAGAVAAAAALAVHSGFDFLGSVGKPMMVTVGQRVDGTPPPPVTGRDRVGTRRAEEDLPMSEGGIGKMGGSPDGALDPSPAKDCGPRAVDQDYDPDDGQGAGEYEWLTLPQVLRAVQQTARFGPGCAAPPPTPH